MLINFEKEKLTIGQLLSRNINDFITDDEKKIVKVITAWEGKTLSFPLTTSGSTGNPTSIELTREQLAYSARTSLSYLDPDAKFESTLLCINPHFIGGMMVIIRALIRSLDLTFIPASSDLKNLPSNHTYDLTSLVPIQLQELLDHHPHKLQQFRTILIGGAPLSKHYRDRLQEFSHLRVYQTYGMTETASHVALKSLSTSEDHYHTLGDLQISTDDRNCLQIRGTITNNQWVQTNDVVRLISPSAFEWLGRADFAINSGGIKIHPEKLEEQLSDQIKLPYFVAGMPDERLGERVELFVESSEPLTIGFEHIDKYHQPKKIHFLHHFVYTESGKINRKKTLALISHER